MAFIKPVSSVDFKSRPMQWSLDVISAV